MTKLFKNIVCAASFLLACGAQAQHVKIKVLNNTELYLDSLVIDDYYLGTMAPAGDTLVFLKSVTFDSGTPRLMAKAKSKNETLAPAPGRSCGTSLRTVEEGEIVVQLKVMEYQNQRFLKLVYP